MDNFNSGDSSMVSSLACPILLLVGMAGGSIHFSLVDRDSSCQEGYRAGLLLHEWLMVWGVVPIVMVGVMISHGLYINVVPRVAPVVRYIYIGIPVLYAIYACIWTIMGIVILSTNENNNCVAQGKGMAVMSIIDIAIGTAMQFALSAIMGSAAVGFR